MNKWTLFGVFFRIGIGTIGGGYAMIPMMEHEIVHRHSWLSREDFMDMIAVSQTSPGVFAVNISSHIGYKLGGFPLALICALGTILPSFLIILSIAMGLSRYRDLPAVEYAFRAIRPVVVALIAAPVFTMAKSARLSWSNCWIPIASAGAIYLLGISPIYIILLAGCGGWLYGYLTDRNHRDQP